MLQHEKLWGSEESEFLTPIAKALQPAYQLGLKYAPHSWLLEQQVELAEFAQYLGNGLAALYASRADGKRWVEQTPSYTLIAEQLALMFPAAQFLFIIRDGRQVADSMQRMWQWNISTAVTTWQNHVMAGLSLQAHCPERVLEIRYETLVRQPDQCFQLIFDFLGLEHSKAAAEFTRSKPINVAPGTENQSRQDKLAPRWHNWSRSDKRKCAKIINPLLTRLGYH